jgi:hypothetical protein
MMDALIKAKVDEYAKWAKLSEECKQVMEKLKGEFQKLGVEALNDKKSKQVEFWGTNSKIVVTCSESLKVVSHTYLLKTLGDVLKDFSKEKVTYDYSKPFENILISLFQGAYVEETLDDVIDQISTNDKIRKVLKKKLKGNWKKDVDTIQNVTGKTRNEAEYYAYFIQEAINYGKIIQLLETAGYHKGTDEFDAAVQAIRNAVIVEESIKVGLETEEVS